VTANIDLTALLKVLVVTVMLPVVLVRLGMQGIAVLLCKLN